ncbi:MAG: transcription termination/antitermination protein NusG [Oscillospiraceae bacterium]|nr:transcription termination/antitermination protein NusG [Oscillospiraceae bacterium]
MLKLEEAKWYVVQTYSGYENNVAANILKVVENNSLADLFHGVKIPTETFTEVKEGKRRTVERKLYQGYIFVKLVLTDDFYHMLRSIRGLVGFVGTSSSKPLPMDEKDVETFGVGVNSGLEISYGEGDLVEILVGPLQGSEGDVSEIDLDGGVVKVNVPMFGKKIPVELRLDDVSPIK